MLDHSSEGTRQPVTRLARWPGPWEAMRKLIKWLWWLALAAVPLSIGIVERRYMDRIGCPPRGDCYVPGSEILIEWDILAMAVTLLVWPVCLWFLVIAPFRAWLRNVA